MMKKKLIAALLAATVAAGTMPSAGALLDGFTASRTYSNQFTDVPTNAWYYNSVKTAYELGLTSGTSATTFSPKKSVNVNETTAFLARIHAVYNGNEITGQPDASWSSKYYDYVTDFIDSGYMGDGLYELAAEPRWEFAYQLSKALPDCEYTEINYIPDGQIPDLPVSQYGYDVVNRIYMLYRAGILSGNDAYGTFAPNSNVTRAEVTAIISRMIDPAQRKTFTLKDKPVTVSLANYVGEWYFNDWPNSGLEIIKNGNDYYLSLGIVQGMGYRTNGTLDPVKLVSKGTYYESLRFDTRGGSTAIAKIRAEGNQLVVSCTEYGTSSLSLNMSGRYCSRG